ncbi:MAG: 50S ribosomal protein L15 [Desulfobacteraceae bacterium]|nr:50S ribosomal protein L15 [Desulfobacteraceae bacterium]
MKLNELSPAEGSRSSRKRLGRGVGSGLGKTAGRGSKGHRSRSGGGVRPGFEGGQMPIHRRLPKRGFCNIFKKKIVILNIGDLKRFESGAIVDEEMLLSAGMAKGRYDGIKLLGKGEIDFPLTVKVNAASKSAIDKIEGAGGKVEVIS